MGNPDPQGLPELIATRRAVEAKGRIITTDLDTHFKELRRAQSSTNVARELSGVVGGTPAMMARLAHLKRRAQSGASVDRVFDTPYNPFRNRTAVETPKNDKERRARYRFYAQYEPYVGGAIDLHAEFPLSTFELVHEDEVLQREFNEIAESVDLSTFLISMAKEYWTTGEAIPFGFFDDPKDPSVWTKFIVLNPDLVRIIHHPMMTGQFSQDVFLELDSVIQNIVQRGPYDPETRNAFHRLPEDVIQYARRNQPMPLAPIQVSHIKRTGSNTFGLRGESILSRVLHILAYRDKLRDGQYTVCDRHVTPKEMYFIGSDAEPADQSEIDAFRDMLESSWLDPNLAIVWHHAVNVQWMGMADKILPLRQEYDQLTKELMAGLMMNETFITGQGPTYANASVALDVLISRYIVFRQMIEKWMIQHVFAPLCRIHGIYKTTEAELRHRIRVKGSPKKEWTPDIAWAKYELRDNYQKIQLYERLVEKGLLPTDYLYNAANLNPTQVRKKLKIEMKQKAEQMAKMPPAGPPAPGGAPELPGLPGGGGGEGGGGEGGEEGGPLPGIPPITMEETPPNIEIPGPPEQRPPESDRAVGLPTG